jgi:hypothetical protein
MTLEQRVERLENFMGDIDKITSVYANSVQQICDKYLNLLYIETYDSSHPERLTIDGFLSEVTSIASLPHNVCFNIRPSHNFAYGSGSGGTSSKIRFKRGNTYIDLPLKKYDVENPGVLKFLEPGDYLMGALYGVYIDSQNVAIISSNDAATVALQEVQQIGDALDALSATVSALATTQTVGSIAVTNGTIARLTVSQTLTLTNAFSLPTGSTCSNPTSNTHVANKQYVDSQITAAINSYHTNYHKFTTGDPNVVLSSAPEKAICFKY